MYVRKLLADLLYADETTHDETRLLLIGVTSYDIQSTANVIARRAIYQDPRSTTEFLQCDLEEHGTLLKLTVAPGFMDSRSDKTPQQMKADIQYELQKSHYEEGFHGVIMVMRYPIRWTDEEKDNIKFAVDIVKQSNLEKHGFLVLTDGLNFKRKYDVDLERNLRDYLIRQGGSEPELQRFLQLFNNKIFILDTELGDSDMNDFQVERLFQYLHFVENPFSLYASALSLYSIPSMLFAGIFSCLQKIYSYKPGPWMVWKMRDCYNDYFYGDAGIKKRRNNSYDTLPDAGESKIVIQLECESKVENMEHTMQDAIKEL